ncbi:hypothetical protein [Streptomyces xinghaiensis]|uniref:hypothetical protein n=1 Tax=Streptomyces xinghaiensis TaxID=1038928 RepID=UPI002E11DAD8|nr:hypothetical protein OG463_27430 [Streptomyces xinghaiensis]
MAHQPKAPAGPSRGPAAGPVPWPSGRPRAAVFALTGTVLAVAGHHAVLDVPVPWGTAAVLAAAQYAAVRPLARRRRALPAVVAATLAAQAVLHTALSLAAGCGPAAGHAAHAAQAADGGGLPGRGADGALAAAGVHLCHPAPAAMTAAHVLAALAVAWLLHRTDTTAAAAARAARAVRRAAGEALAALLTRCPRPAGPTGRAPEPADTAVPAEPPSPAREFLASAVVRRGPPDRKRNRGCRFPAPVAPPRSGRSPEELPHVRSPAPAFRAPAPAHPPPRHGRRGPHARRRRADHRSGPRPRPRHGR